LIIEIKSRIAISQAARME